MAIGKLKTLDNIDKTQDVSRLNQLIDIISADISSSSNRRRYLSFITGNNTKVESSLFQTIFDQDQSLQSANALFDITFGVYADTDTDTMEIFGSTVVESLPNKKIDSAGKYIFEDSTSCMMREKISIYRQYAQNLLGNAKSVFRTSHNANTSLTNNIIKEALFINIKRLFKRDQISKGTVGLKLFNRVGSNLKLEDNATNASNGTLFTSPTTSGYVGQSSYELNNDLVEEPVYLIDTNASIYYNVGISGEVGTLKLVLGNNEPKNCGLIFYDMGILVLDVDVIFNLNDNIQGIIDFPDETTADQVTFKLFNNVSRNVTVADGKKALGNIVDGSAVNGTLKHFLQLAPIDQIINHFCESRFIDSTDTAFTFHNETIINSTIFHCNAALSDFNYSSNPTYTDENGKIVVVKNLNDQPFSYITSVGLYDNRGDLLAIAKLSRPVEKNPTSQLSLRVRLDY